MRSNKASLAWRAGWTWPSSRASALPGEETIFLASQGLPHSHFGECSHAHAPQPVSSRWHMAFGRRVAVASPGSAGAASRPPSKSFAR